MSYYIANGTFYAVPQRSDELYHYGVKGMKWGHRKRQDPVSGVGRRLSGAYQNMSNNMAARKQAAQQQRQARQAERNTPEAQAKRAERVAKAKKAAKIGAAVAGTALAAYGTYKLAKFVQGQRSQAAMQKAQAYVDKNVFNKVGETTFRDGTRRMDFVSNAGHKITTQGSRSEVGKVVGKHNAEVVAKGRQMYKDATNTRLDRGLAKVVNAGDAVGNAAKRTAAGAKNAANNAKNTAKNAGNAVKTSANKAKNKVLDVVNPIYEYTPQTTTKSWHDSNTGIDWTDTVTNYYKTKKKRT